MCRRVSWARILPFAFGDRGGRAVGVLDKQDQLERGDDVPGGQVPQVADGYGITGAGPGAGAGPGDDVGRQDPVGDRVGLGGPPAEVLTITVVGFDRGLIASQRILWEHATLTAQLGIPPLARS
jgi:hypothetical protein